MSSQLRYWTVSRKYSLIANKVFFADTAKILEFCSVQTVSLRQLRNHFVDRKKLLCRSQFNMYLLELIEGKLLTEIGNGVKRKYHTTPEGLQRLNAYKQFLVLTEAPL
ncbi:MAG: hypothetical protein FWC33_03120 [Candidatus Bathyarchaeota archaeon]|nr:hypothetical protein [Candidatus Termiticorpusculum sp.]